MKYIFKKLACLTTLLKLRVSNLITTSKVAIKCSWLVKTIKMKPEEMQKRKMINWGNSTLNASLRSRLLKITIILNCFGKHYRFFGLGLPFNFLAICAPQGELAFVPTMRGWSAKFWRMSLLQSLSRKNCEFPQCVFKKSLISSIARRNKPRISITNRGINSEFRQIIANYVK